MTDGWNRLTRTELAVVRLTSSGLSNREIGDVMHISPRTVQRHLYEIFRKVNVSTRTQLATAAVRRGVADEEAIDRGEPSHLDRELEPVDPEER